MFNTFSYAEASKRPHLETEVHCTGQPLKFLNANNHQKMLSLLHSSFHKLHMYSHLELFHCQPLMIILLHYIISHYYMALC